MRLNYEQLGLVGLLVVFIALATAYSVVTPLGEGPDEVSHFAYIQYVLMHQRLPTAEGAVLGEAHQPPLYYVLCALAAIWIPQQEFTPIANPDFAFEQPHTPNLLLHPQREAFPYRDAPLAWHWLRLLSVAMGAITVWATWRIAAIFFPTDWWLVAGATAFVAFLPAFTFLSAMINNDNLVITFSALGLLQLFRIARQPWWLGDMIRLGVLLGLAVLTKLSGLVLWLFAAGVFAFLAWHAKRREWKHWTLRITICFGIALAVIAPWLAYNVAQYGDPLGWSLVLSVTPLRQAPLTLDDLVRIIGWGLYTSFWGRFGGALHLRMSGAIYVVLGVVTLLALLGWARAARASRLFERDSNLRALVAAFVVFWLLMLTAFARWTLTVLGTDQARQLFPGLPLLAPIFVVALAGLVPTRRKITLTAFGGGLLALNIAVLLYLNATFAGASADLRVLPRLGGSVAPADFGDTIRVLDYRVEPTRVAPGGSVTVELYWQALTSPDENYWLLLQLANRENVQINKDGVPANGRPTTDRWQKDQVFVSRHTLAVPGDAALGAYILKLGLHPFERWEWLPVQGQEMLTLGSVVVATSP